MGVHLLLLLLLDEKTTPSSHLPHTIPSWSVTGKMASGYVDPEGSDGGWSRLITTLPTGRAEICHCSPPSNPPWNNWSLVNDQHSSGQTALVPVPWCQQLSSARPHLKISLNAVIQQILQPRVNIAYRDRSNYCYFRFSYKRCGLGPSDYFWFLTLTLKTMTQDHEYDSNDHAFFSETKLGGSKAVCSFYENWSKRPSLNSTS